MDEQALKSVFDEFLRDFERVLDDHVRELRDVMTPTAQQDSQQLVMREQMADILDAVNRIAIMLEERDAN